MASGMWRHNLGILKRSEAARVLAALPAAASAARQMAPGGRIRRGIKAAR